jgi:hypothetical protein
MSHSPWGKEEKWRYQHISSGCVRLLANIFFLRNRRSSAGASTENFIKKQPKRVRRAKQAHTKINKEGDGEGERGDSRNKGGDKENYKLHPSGTVPGLIPAQLNKPSVIITVCID